MPNVSSYMVYHGGKQVLRLKDRPGRLTSTAMLGPGQESPTHPFLSADALDPLEEDPLRRILDSSKSFDDFVSRLKAAGYDVRPDPPKK